MTTVTYQRPVALDRAAPPRPRFYSHLMKFMVALLIVVGAPTAANPSVPGSILSTSGGPAAQTHASTGAQLSAFGPAPTAHTASARERVHSAQQLTRCVHRAHRTSTGPAACVSPRR